MDELLKKVDKWSPSTFMAGPPSGPPAVHFCTSCLRKHYQFKKALLVNVLMMSLYRLQNPVDISWHIVLARDGGEAAGVEVDIGFGFI